MNMVIARRNVMHSVSLYLILSINELVKHATSDVLSHVDYRVPEPMVD